MPKRISHLTPGVRDLPYFRLGQIAEAFGQAVADNPDDWFYEVKIDEERYWVVENEQGAYTAMLPEEYWELPPPPRLSGFKGEASAVTTCLAKPVSSALKLIQLVLLDKLCVMC